MSCHAGTASPVRHGAMVRSCVVPDIVLAPAAKHDDGCCQQPVHAVDDCTVIASLSSHALFRRSWPQIPPLVVPPSMPLDMIYSVVTTMGLEYLPVVAQLGPLEGLISRQVSSGQQQRGRRLMLCSWHATDEGNMHKLCVRQQAQETVNVFSR
jgi:hypothetical protein